MHAISVQLKLREITDEINVKSVDKTNLVFYSCEADEVKCDVDNGTMRAKPIADKCGETEIELLPAKMWPAIEEPPAVS